MNLQLGTDKFGESLSAEGLGALNGGTKGTVNDQLREDTKSTRDTEQDGVIVGLSQAIVLKKDTGVLKIDQHFVDL